MKSEVRPLRVYIAGALSSKEKADRNPSQVIVDYLQNLHRMFRVATEVRNLGHIPYVPGLDFLLGITAGGWDENDYRGMGMGFLEVCDVVLVTSWSWGVDKEVTRAKELGIPVIDKIDLLPLIEKSLRGKDDGKGNEENLW